MKNLFKFLLLGAFTLSLGVGFVGCKNYDDDIKAICERLDTAEAAIKKLQEQTPGVYVTNITEASTGITVAYSNGDSKVVATPVAGGGGHPAKVSGDAATGYTISIWDDTATPAAYVDIKLPTAADAVGHIEILGWAAQGASLANNVWTGDVTKNYDLSYIANSGAMVVNWARVTGFPIEKDALNNAGTPGATGAPTSWAGGATKVEKNNVLHTMNSERKGFFVQAYPSTADLTNIKFTVQDSKGGVLPLVGRTPEKVSGYALTRAAEGSAIWFIGFDYEDSAKTYNTDALYTNQYGVTISGATGTGTRSYTLVANGTYRTDYTPFNINTEKVASIENALVDIKTGPAKAASTASGHTTVYPWLNVEYSPVFTQFALAGSSPNITANGVVDWYFEIADDNQFGPNKFGIKFNDTKTAFTVTNMPDELTLADFDLNIYKLGVDGKIWFETITVDPVRSNLSEPVPLGKDYLIIDKEGVASPSVYTADKMVFNLQPMFDKLKTVDAGNGQTMFDRWTDATYGARTYSVVSVKIGDKTLGSATSPKLDQWEDVFKLENATANGMIGNSKADGTGTESGANVIDAQAAADGIWYKAKSIIIPATYAAADGDMTNPDDSDSDPDQTFEVGKEYQITLDFADKDGNYLNTAVLTFTPKLPALADMFKKEDIYWDKTTTPWTLNAYYRTPDPTNVTADAYFYTAGTAGTDYPAGGSAGTSTYYNVLRASSQVAHTKALPADGGFTKFGELQVGSAPYKEQWLASVGMGLVDGTKKYDGVNASTLVGFGATVKTVVELIDQTAATSPGTDGDGYKKDFNIRLSVGKYLDTYAYSDDDIKAQDFNLRIMSALYEGGVRAASNTLTIKAADGNMGSLTNADLQVYNYDNVAFNLFPVVKSEGSTTVVWDYTYIKSISFSIVSGTGVTIVDASGNTIASGSQTYTDPSWATGTTAMIPAKLYLKGSNVTTGDKFTLRVSVADRYGKVKNQDIEMTLAMN